MSSLISNIFAILTGTILSFYYQFFPQSQPIIVHDEPRGKIIKISTPSAKLQINPADFDTIYSISPSPSPVPSAPVTPTPTGLPWGRTEKLREHIYRTFVGQDAVMGSAKETLDALNVYRKNHGRQSVSNDDRLCELARFRALQQDEKNTLDDHKGFIEYLEDPKHWEYLNVKAIGENASYGYRLSGEHLIEWIFDADEEHRNNQLNPQWNRACVAISGLLVEILFADK